MIFLTELSINSVNQASISRYPKNMITEFFNIEERELEKKYQRKRK